MKTYDLKLSIEQLQTVAAGLNELPRKFSQPVVEDIERQLDAQDKAEAAAVKAEAEKVQTEVAKEKPDNVVPLHPEPEDPSQ